MSIAFRKIFFCREAQLKLLGKKCVQSRFYTSKKWMTEYPKKHYEPIKLWKQIYAGDTQKHLLKMF